jgi:5-(carboxyamino)imidazole ribonucleotide synthase
MNKKVLGIIGGGQLGMFICIAARKVGVKTVIYSNEEHFSAKEFCDHYFVGDTGDEIKIDEFIDSADFFTIETENIPKEFLRKIKNQKKLFPSSEIIEIAQNRLKEKKFLNNIIGIKTAPYFEINDFEELKTYSKEFGYNCILKTQEFGYDGKGQYIIKNSNLEKFKNLNLTNFILEKKINFHLEISVIVIGNHIKMIHYPPVENHHKHSILRQTIFPANISEKISKKAIKIALKISRSLKLEGVLAVEMFVTKDAKILINELAPRPHNSGHWTMDSSKFSQFDNLVSLIIKNEVRVPNVFRKCKMINIIGKDYLKFKTIKKKFIAYDYYKKQVRPSRKMGHYIDFE